MYRSALLVAALLLAGGCHKRPQRTPPTEAECESYRQKLFTFMPADERDAMAKMGLGKQTPKELEICQQRLHSDEIACVVAAKSLDEALACKSAVDDRPADVKRTHDECVAYSTQVKKLAAQNSGEDSAGPPFTPFMASLSAGLCEHWLSKDRYECVMKAATSMDLMSCPP